MVVWGTDLDRKITARTAFLDASPTVKKSVSGNIFI